MPDMTTSQPRLLRLCASVAAATLLLTACSGSGDDGPRDPEPTEQPTPSTTVKVPKAANITPPGTKLGFGDTATVAHEAGKQGTVLALRVESAEQGSLADLSGFNLDDPYKKRGNYYYVRVSVSNAGRSKVGGLPVPLWGISGDNTLLRAVEFKSSFKKCPTQPLPKKFAPGEDFKTCLVFLSPNRGSLDGVGYRPKSKYLPIEWRGKVKMLPKKKTPSKQKDERGKGAGKG